MKNGHPLPITSNGLLSPLATAPAKRKAKPRSKRTVKQPGWHCVCNLTGESVHVPGIAPDRWFKARAAGVALLGAKLGRDVSQDAVRCEWVEGDEGKVGAK